MKLTKITEPVESKPRKDPSFVGDLTEFEATVWLLKNNYRVFKNCERTGPADFIVINPDKKIIIVDVKKHHRPSARSSVQKELGVTFLKKNRKGKFYFSKHRS